MDTFNSARGCLLPLFRAFRHFLALGFGRSSLTSRAVVARAPSLLCAPLGRACGCGYALQIVRLVCIVGRSFLLAALAARPRSRPTAASVVLWSVVPPFLRPPSSRSRPRPPLGACSPSAHGKKAAGASIALRAGSLAIPCPRSSSSSGFVPLFRGQAVRFSSDFWQGLMAFIRSRSSSS